VVVAPCFLLRLMILYRAGGPVEVGRSEGATIRSHAGGRGLLVASMA
jgi:hypothetical protein